MADQNKSYELTDDELNEVVGGTSVEQLGYQGNKCFNLTPGFGLAEDVVDPNLKGFAMGVVDDPALKEIAMGVVNAPEAAPKGTMGI